MEKARKKLLIYPKFQLILLGVNAGITILILIAISVQATRAFTKVREILVDAGMNPNSPNFRLIDFQEKLVFTNLMLAFAIGLILSSLLILVLSHQLSGPIVRLRSYFEAVGKEGSVISPLKFRKRDFFQELPQAINEALKRIQK